MGMIDDQIPVSKPCIICKEVKVLDLFPRCKTGKDGHTNICKVCDNEIHKRNKAKRRPAIRESSVEYRKRIKEEFKSGKRKSPERKVCPGCMIEKESSLFGRNLNNLDGLAHYCRECTTAYNKEYKKNNVEKVKETQKRYMERTKEEHIEYRKKNREKIRVRKNEYENRRRKEDPEYRFLCATRSRIYSALKNHQKSAHSRELLGCDVTVACAYLESQFYPNPETGEEMTWDNYGRPGGIEGWDFEHVIPLISFDLTSSVGQRTGFNACNMQPMWLADHREKHRLWGDDAPPGVYFDLLWAKFFEWRKEWEMSLK